MKRSSRRLSISKLILCDMPLSFTLLVSSVSCLIICFFINCNKLRVKDDIYLCLMGFSVSSFYN